MTKITDIAQTPEGWMGLDIGPKTIELFAAEISTARTIVWNGPLGMFERPAFAQGTLAIARAIAAASGKGATSIIGGGDSVAAVEQSGLAVKCRTSPPAAALRWNFSRAKNFRASKR